MNPPVVVRNRLSWITVPDGRKTRIFVSYSRHDEEAVRGLTKYITLSDEQIVFLDVESLRPGMDWSSEIDAAIREADIFVLCWCCKCAESSFIAHEVKLALSSGPKKIVPVRMCSYPVPKPLSKYQWLDKPGGLVHMCSGHGWALLPKIGVAVVAVMNPTLGLPLLAVSMASLVYRGYKREKIEQFYDEDDAKDVNETYKEVIDYFKKLGFSGDATTS